MIRFISANINREAQKSGYLAVELYRNEYLRKWEDIEKERDQLRSAAHIHAEKMALKFGHKMGKWSNINTSRCTVCNRFAHVKDILSRMATKFDGPVFEHPCDDTVVETSKDNWHWQFNAYME